MVASVLDPRLAADYRFAGVEMYRRAEMGADGRLTEALRAWETGDHGLFHRDREAHQQVEESYRASVLRSVRRHPSVLGRAGS